MIRPPPGQPPNDDDAPMLQPQQLQDLRPPNIEQIDVAAQAMPPVDDDNWLQIIKEHYEDEHEQEPHGQVDTALRAFGIVVAAFEQPGSRPPEQLLDGESIP